MQAILDPITRSSMPARQICSCYTASGKLKKIAVKTTYATEAGGERQLIAVLTDVTAQEQNRIYRRDVTILMASFFAMICLYTFAVKAIGTLAAPENLTLGCLAAIFVLSVFLAKTTSVRPVIRHGKEAERRDILAALLFAAAGVGAMIAVKLAGRAAGIAFFSRPEPFFDFSKFTAKEIYRYLPSVILQEYLARSFLQESFRRVFGEKYGWAVIAVSSLIFGTLHLHLTLALMICASLMMGVLGVFYQRHRSLAAVTVAHFAAAEAAIILGFIG